jgi:transcriptional regulator with XRE-family HTH domain
VRGRGLSACVRARRLGMRLTQREAAARAEVSLATWQAVERAGAEISAFQQLTLARVAHGLGIELTTLLAEAEPDAGADGAGTARAEEEAGAPAPPPAGATGEVPDDAAALVADVGAALLRLAAVSAPTFHLVAGQALDAADRFLQVLDDR